MEMCDARGYSHMAPRTVDRLSLGTRTMQEEISCAHHAPSPCKHGRESMRHTDQRHPPDTDGNIRRVRITELIVTRAVASLVIIRVRNVVINRLSDSAVSLLQDFVVAAANAVRAHPAERSHFLIARTSDRHSALQINLAGTCLGVWLAACFALLAAFSVLALAAAVQRRCAAPEADSTVVTIEAVVEHVVALGIAAHMCVYLCQWLARAENSRQGLALAVF